MVWDSTESIWISANRNRIPEQEKTVGREHMRDLNRSVVRIEGGMYKGKRPLLRPFCHLNEKNKDAYKSSWVS